MEKKYFMLSFLALALMMSIISVSAITVPNGVVIIKPTAGSYSQNLTLQVMNVTNLFDGFNNCTFYMKSGGLTANTTWINLVGTIINSTLNSVNSTYNTTAFEDGTDYTLNATCKNMSNDIAYATVLLTIDNTVPTAPTSISPSDNTVLSSAADETFSSTVTDSKTTSCSYIIGRGGTSTSSQDTETGSGTYSAGACSFIKSFSDQNDNGIWYYYFTASDGTNTTSSVTQTLQVGINPTGGYNPDEDILPTQTTTSSIGTIVTNIVQSNILYFLIVIIVIIVIAVIVGKRMKK